MTPWKITWNILGRSRLREHQLYVKKEKCEFAQQEIRFLRHKVSKGLSLDWLTITGSLLGQEMGVDTCMQRSF